MGGGPGLPADLTGAKTVEEDSQTSMPPSSGLHGRFEPGTKLGKRYRVVGLLGKGGMGEVYRADDLELNQSVALKFLPDKVASNPVEIERLKKEVRLARGISHPNVCRIYDIAEADGHVFLVMEYIDGEDLGSVLRRMGRPSRDKAVEIARQLTMGLAAAHEQGVIHRDLKPGNVMIDGRGRVRITDFGLSGLAEELAADTAMVGTPAYMAPEQLTRNQVSVASDIYALGLTLYEVFTGKRVFESRNITELKKLHSDSSITTPSDLVQDIDPAVERVILLCLETDPNLRPKSAYSVLGALPGGDPLAAAMAAGETPSPDLVASVGGVGSLRPRTALLVLVITVACLAGSIVVFDMVSPDLEKSPQELALRAKQILEAAGISELPRYSDSGFMSNALALQYFEENDSLLTEKAGFKVGFPEYPPSVVYYHRWSPRFQRPADIHVPQSTLLEPPQVFPGSATVVLDPTGRLVALQVVPDPEWAGSGESVNWNRLLGESGYHSSDVTMMSLSPGGGARFDSSLTGSASLTMGGGEVLTFFVGSSHGRPVHFSISGDWGSTERLDDLDAGQANADFPWVFILMVVLLPMVVTVILARHNIRLGRGDRRGATRLSLCIFVAYMLQFLFAMNISEIGFTRTMRLMVGGTPIAHAVLHAVIVWVAYMAIEPYVRKLWPRFLVSWARASSGRFRDPIVGRDILLGMLVAVVTQVVTITGLFVALSSGVISPTGGPSPSVLEALVGAKDVMSMLSASFAFSVQLAMTLFTIMLIFRLVFRKNILALIGVTVLYTALISSEIQSGSVAFDLGFALIWTLGIVFAGVRIGFLAFLSCVFAQFVFFFVPVTLDVSDWVFDRALVGLLVLAGLLAFAFTTSLGGQPLFRDILKEPEASDQ